MAQNEEMDLVSALQRAIDCNEEEWHDVGPKKFKTLFTGMMERLHGELEFRENELGILRNASLPPASGKGVEPQPANRTATAAATNGAEPKRRGRPPKSASNGESNVADDGKGDESSEDDRIFPDDNGAFPSRSEQMLIASQRNGARVS
jgi:hypothetical protein